MPCRGARSCRRVRARDRRLCIPTCWGRPALQRSLSGRAWADACRDSWWRSFCGVKSRASMIFFLHCSFFIGFIVHSLQTFEQVHPDAIPTLGDRDGTLKCRWPTTGGSLDLIWSNWLMSESRKVRAGTGINFPQQQNLAMGSLAQISSGAIRCSFKTRFRGSGGLWCRYLVRFPRVPVKIPAEAPEGSVRLGFRCIPRREVPEVSSAGTWWGSGGLRCRYSTLWGSGGFWCKCFVKFQRVLMFFMA